jgi:hypothetical protein
MGSTITHSDLITTGRCPKGFSPCPENEEFAPEIRQMVIGRYRILFTIKGRKVHVLHVRGSYSE